MTVVGRDALSKIGGLCLFYSKGMWDGRAKCVWNVEMGCSPKDLVQSHSSGSSSLGAGILYLFKSSI